MNKKTATLTGSGFLFAMNYFMPFWAFHSR